MHAQEPKDGSSGIVLVGLGLLACLIGLVYGSHKYQMWRSRRKRDREKERRDA